MFIKFGPAMLSCIIATSITLIELISSEYFCTWAFIKKCWSLYVYGIIYGLIAWVFMFGFDHLLNLNIIKIEGLVLSSPWFHAIVIGISTKAFMHINIINVSIGSSNIKTTQIPIGLETIIKVFEPVLLRKIKLYHYEQMSVFLEDHLKSYNDLEDIKSKITETVHTANFLTEQDKNVFKLDIGATRNPHEAMQLFLVTFGTTTFKRVFPRQ